MASSLISVPCPCCIVVGDSRDLLCCQRFHQGHSIAEVEVEFAKYVGLNSSTILETWVLKPDSS